MGKINDYATGTAGPTDKLLASDGGTGVTKNLLVSDIDNFANADLTFTTNRAHDTAGNSFELTTDGGVFAESYTQMDSTFQQIGFNDNFIYFDSSIVDIWLGGKSLFSAYGNRFITKSGVIKYLTNQTVGLTLTDTYHIVNCNGTFTVNLPTAVGVKGLEYIIKNSGVGTITLDGDGTETIDGNLTASISTMKCITVVSDGTNWIITNY